MSDAEVSQVGVIDPNATAKKDDEKLSIQSYKILTTTIATSLTFSTTMINVATNTAGLKSVFESAAINIGMTTNAVSMVNINRGFVFDMQFTGAAWVYHSFSHRIFRNKYTVGELESVYAERSVSTVRYPIKSESIFGPADYQIHTPAQTYFHDFKFDQISLKRHDEVNVNTGSQFTYTRPQQFEFSYVRGADNDELNYGLSAKLLAKNKYKQLTKLSANVFPAIAPTDYVAPEVVDGAQRRWYQVSDDEDFAPAGGGTFKAAWMDQLTGPHYWVRFPIDDDLDAMLGPQQAQLIKDSGEYKLHKRFFEMLNNGDLADIMNHPIPSTQPTNPLLPQTIPNAIPLSRLPKDLAYNMKHHGILKIDFARGQRQQYNVITATGKVFVIGATHTYYTHNRKVINFLEYGEKHDVYKFFVHSTANYHFACKASMPPVYGGQRPAGTSEVNYRYEGNFNIEQVTADPWTYREENGANTSTGGRLNTYVQGIHGVKSQHFEMLKFRSPILELVSTDKRAYEPGVAEKRDAMRSELVLLPQEVVMGVFSAGENKDPQAFISLQDSKVFLRGENINIGAEKAIQVTGNTLFTGSVTIDEDPQYRLTAKNVTLSRVSGSVSSSGTWNFS